MTHEPECPRFGLEMPHALVVPCLCYIAEAAYQRGREDAANAVERVKWWQGRVETHSGPNWGRHCDRDVAIAAARGDGDCQHDWQHLKGEKCPTCRRCGAARGDGEQG